MKKTTSVRRKIVLIALLGTLLLGIYFTYVNTLSTFRLEREETMNELVQLTQSLQLKIFANIESGYSMARSTANMLARPRHKPEMRTEVLRQFEKIIQAYPNVASATPCFEPNAFDGEDVNFIYAPGCDYTGRFVPAFMRDAQGRGKHIDTSFNYKVDSHDSWYYGPKRSHSTYVTNPYTSMVGGVDVPMFTVSEPILVDGDFIGIVAVDLTLDKVTEWIENADIDRSKSIISLFTPKREFIASSSEEHLELGAESFIYQYVNSNEEIATLTPDGHIVENFDGYVNIIFPIFVGSHEAPLLLTHTIAVNTVLSSARLKVFHSLIVALILILAISLVLWYTLGRTLAPLKAITSHIRQIATGDLREKAISGLTRADEIGQIAQSFQEMLGRLRHMVSGIRASSEQLVLSSKEIADSATSIANANTGNAATTEEVQAQCATLHSSSQEDQKAAQDALKDVQAAIENLEKFAASVHDANGKLRNIVLEQNNLAEIGSQSSFLALNAAVEAARAGEAGRGFAVVASEVHKLADRSQEIVVKVNEASASAMDSAQTTFKGLQSLGEVMENLTGSIRQQAESTNFATDAVRQIDDAMASLSQSTQASAATSEELAASSEHLLALAQDLDDNVAFFQL